MAGVLSSLDLLRESVEEVARCPRVPWDVVAIEDPSLRFPATCKTWGCSYCGPRKARQKAALMSWARPERFVGLTDAPADWQTCRFRVRELARQLRKHGYRWEMAWTVEANPARPDLRHIHGLQHGSYVPQKHLQALWGPIVDVRAIKGSRGAVAGYAMKEALQVVGYTAKGMGDLPRHLELNGGRGVHMTRRFLRGCTTDEALAQIQRQRYGDFTWVLVRRGVALSETGLGRLPAAAIPPEMAQS